MKIREHLKGYTIKNMVESDGSKKKKEDMQAAQQSNVVTNGTYVTASQTHATNVVKIMAWTVVAWHRGVKGEKTQERHIAK